MTQYIDKSAVVAEIKRRRKLVSDPILSGDDLMIGERNALFNLLSFINTLEVKEVDSDAHWISVEDELPPNKGGFSDEVLTYDHASKRYVVAMFCYISNCWFGCDDTITHWMPLPAAPKKGGEE